MWWVGGELKNITIAARLELTGWQGGISAFLQTLIPCLKFPVRIQSIFKNSGLFNLIYTYILT
jgi:hypothetical protein